MDVPNQGKKILDDLDRVGASFGQLPHVGSEMHVFRVHRIEHGVNLIAEFDRSAGVLVQGADDADIRKSLPISFSDAMMSALLALKSYDGRLTLFGPTTAVVPP